MFDTVVFFFFNWDDDNKPNEISIFVAKPQPNQYCPAVKCPKMECKPNIVLGEGPVIIGKNNIFFFEMLALYCDGWITVFFFSNYCH